MKTKEEFNLSEKILNSQKILDSDRIFDVGQLVYFLELKDVKEFIRLLKEELKKFSDATEYGVSRVIDKLAGEKLK